MQTKTTILLTLALCLGISSTGMCAPPSLDRVTSLRQMNAKELVAVVEPLIDALKQKDAPARRTAARDLFWIAYYAPVDSSGLDALINALGDKDQSVRNDVARVLGLIGPETKDAVPKLIEMLKNDTGWFARSSAAHSLGKIGPDAKSAVPALIEAMKDRIAGVRGAAILALGEIGPNVNEAAPL